jgi:hypothetical protein
MTATPDAAVFTADNSDASGPPRPALTGRHAGNTCAIPAAALAVATAVMLLIILAVITLANDGLHANWR